MVTDVEMAAMNGLRWLCEDKLSRDVLEAVTDMLENLDVDAFSEMSDEEQNEFLQEYADEINDSVKYAVENGGVRKRMAAEWEILTSFTYGDREIFIGENPKAEKEIDRYIVGDVVTNELFRRYENCVSGDVYSEMAELYSQRVQGQIEKVKGELAKFPYDRSIIGRDSCESIAERDLRGEIVVINPASIKREYAGADSQLCLALSGFGCSPNGSGRKVYCKNIFTGESAQWLRGDVLGILKAECIPDWVKERATERGTEVLFTFGSSDQFPFKMGYVSITAPSEKEAIAAFQRNWPDVNEGIVNCASIYSEPEAVARIKEHGNGQAGCHKNLDITIPPLQGKVVDQVLADAKSRVDAKDGGGMKRELDLGK